MESTRYLIVGGGMTGDAAVKGIREHDADGSIVLVGGRTASALRAAAAHEGPVGGSGRGEDLARHGGGGAELQLGRRIVSLDLDRHLATDDRGEEYGWEKLLLATGGRPRTIPGPKASSTTERSTTTGRCGRGCTRAQAPS